MFIRFGVVELKYFGPQPIEEKCNLFDAHLSALKSVLKDSKLIEFCAFISQDPDDFNNQLSLLDYIQNRLLAFCDSSRGYEFEISDSDANAITNVIESILLMPPIRRCSVLKIRIHRGEENQLPMEAISDWLEESVDEMQINARTPKEKYLEIRLNGIQNAKELLEHLKMVYLIDLSIIFTI